MTSPLPPEFGPLARQFTFLLEIDRLKTVVRQSPLLDRSRKENSAEHSWHLALYALVLSEYAIGPVDTQRVMRMLLLLNQGEQPECEDDLGDGLQKWRAFLSEE